jgi:hypothetical protein
VLGIESALKADVVEYAGGFSHTLPDAAIAAAGLAGTDARCGELAKPYGRHGVYTTLAELNDTRGLSFAKIADLIESGRLRVEEEP